MNVHLLGPVEVCLDGRPIELGARKQRAVLAMLALQVGCTVPAGAPRGGPMGRRAAARARRRWSSCTSTNCGGCLPATARRSSPAAVAMNSGWPTARWTRSGSSGCSTRIVRARRWRCGAAVRSATSQTSRSPRPRSGVWRSCAFERPSWRSTPTSRPVATARCWARSRHCSSTSRCASDCTRNACSRSTAPGDRPTRWRPIASARSVLVEQIGVEPGPELRRLHEAILRQDPSLEAPAALPPELDTDTPLDGRERELAWLRRHWRRVRGGDGRLVLVTGVAGIGKTRLVAELAAEVLREHGAVAYAVGAPEEVAPRRAGRRCWSSTTWTATRERAALARLVDAARADRRDGGERGRDARSDTLSLTPLERERRARRSRGATLSADVEVPVDRLLAVSGGIPAAAARGRGGVGARAGRPPCRGRRGPRRRRAPRAARGRGRARGGQRRRAAGRAAACRGRA